MSAKRSPRTRKDKQQDFIRQETVAQVHKTTKSNTSSENDYANSEDNIEFTYRYEENENIQHTPSVDISVDGESQINSKIISLIESEMKRDNKKSHFTDSRPQSLSFYEDEKMPEELSGNLELLSPEERKHYKKRKEYMQLDDERNIYNSITDMYNSRDSEDLNTAKKHKYRKKKHAETDIGNSTEMMIPKDRPKRRRKKRENSPNCSNGKKKHKKRDEEYELKNDVTIALEELQDDVFDNQEEVYAKQERFKRSPRRTDKLYVQKKNKFEYIERSPKTSLINNLKDCEGGLNQKEFSTYHPLDIALIFQLWWMRISNICHGLLGGLALGHWLYLICNINSEDNNFLRHYAYYSDFFVALFYGLCVICIISVMDRINLEDVDGSNVLKILKGKSFFVILLYITCLILHLSTSSLDDKIGIITYNETMPNITSSDIHTWNHLSLWRAIFAFTAWIFLGLVPSDDMLYINLKNMERYFPDK